MSQPQMPVHPGRQQGLEPQGTNPYFTPNVGLQQAQAEVAQAQADKARAESSILAAQAAQQGLGSPMQAGPVVTPQEVHAQQLADGILQGIVDPARLDAMVQAGEVDYNVAAAAVGLADQFMAREQQQLQQMDQGLGSF